MNATLKKKSKTNKVLNQVFVFAKAQFSAFVGGITDYMIMIFFTEIFHLTSAQRMLNCILQRVNSNYTVLYVKW